MSRTLIYAGIGSRKTPQAVCDQMTAIAQQLSDRWLLRSGRAQGADLAFEFGALAANGAMEIMVPWYGFNNAPANDPRYIRPKATEELAEFTSRYHPAWSSCSSAAKLMHMRNACQILGKDGTEPVDLVICWTPGGQGNGGTGQAIRIAHAHNIPVFDLGDHHATVPQMLCKFVAALEEL